MENMGVERMVKKLTDLNPTKSFKALDWNMIAVKRFFHGKIKIPEGYEYNKKNGLTNKHKTESGLYETFWLVYEPSLFQKVVRMCKRFF